MTEKKNKKETCQPIEENFIIIYRRQSETFSHSQLGLGYERDGEKVS